MAMTADLLTTMLSQPAPSCTHLFPTDHQAMRATAPATAASPSSSSDDCSIGMRPSASAHLVLLPYLRRAPATRYNACPCHVILTPVHQPMLCCMVLAEMGFTMVLVLFHQYLAFSGAMHVWIDGLLWMVGSGAWL